MMKPEFKPGPSGPESILFPSDMRLINFSEVKSWKLWFYWAFCLILSIVSERERSNSKKRKSEQVLLEINPFGTLLRNNVLLYFAACANKNYLSKINIQTLYSEAWLLFFSCKNQSQNKKALQGVLLRVWLHYFYYRSSSSPWTWMLRKKINMVYSSNPLKCLRLCQLSTNKPGY